MTAIPSVAFPAAKAPSAGTSTGSASVTLASSAGSFGNSAVKTAENAAVREAKDLPDLIRKLEVVNPALAAQFVGKSLAASRTPWGTLLLPVVAYLAARYGLGWTPDIDALMAGVAVLVGSYAMRFMTSTPITSLFGRVPPTVPTTPVVIPVIVVGTTG